LNARVATAAEPAAFRQRCGKSYSEQKRSWGCELHVRLRSIPRGAIRRPARRYLPSSRRSGMVTVRLAITKSR